MRRRDFPNCEYGPFQLRRLLRARLLPGEKIVGWAPALANPPVWLLIAVAGLALVPAAGHMLIMVILANHRRVVILTDSRIMVLSRLALAGDPGGRGVRTDLPLHALALKKTRSAHRFRLQARGSGRGETLSIENRTRPAERLIQGLNVLISDAISS